jgi:hypothetical protein
MRRAGSNKARVFKRIVSTGGKAGMIGRDSQSRFFALVLDHPGPARATA